jgi:hypothetical protein
MIAQFLQVERVVVNRHRCSIYAGSIRRRWLLSENDRDSEVVLAAASLEVLTDTPSLSVQ